MYIVILFLFKRRHNGVFDDAGKTLRLETRPADKRPVNIRFPHELGGIVRLYAASVQETKSLGHVLSKSFADLSPYKSVYFLGLRGSGDLSRPNGPHRLIRDDQPLHGFPAQARQSAFDLRFNHLKSLVRS